MLIDYAKANVLTLPLTGKTGAATGSVMLVPGINNVEKNKWDACKELPTIKRLQEEGLLKIHIGTDDTDEDFSLAKATVKEAVGIVRKTWNLLLLEEWKACESRPGVSKEIAAQIRLIETKTKPEKAANG